jgi:hypothetical protein
VLQRFEHRPKLECSLEMPAERMTLVADEGR